MTATVLHYVQSWLPVTQRFVDDLVSRSRHRAVVVAREGRDDAGGRRPHHRPVRSVAPVVQLTRRVNGAIERRALTAALMAIAMRERAAIVHVHFGYVVRDVLGLCQRRRLPLVLSMHGHDATAFASEHPSHYDGVWDRVGAVVVPSQFLAQQAIALGARPETVSVIPAGVDTAFFVPTPLPERPRTVLFIGRFVEKKGLDVLLAAWPGVRSRVPGARLHVLGAGPLEALVASAGPGVTREAPAGHRAREQVRDALRAATVAVTPSHTAADGDADSLVLVNLEAQAAGRPVVTTDHGGIPEFVEAGETALVVPQNDPDALAEAVVRVLTDPRLCARLAQAGPAWARRFELGASVEQCDQLYDRLLARR